MTNRGTKTPVTLAVGFLAFRLFDIVKPFPVRRAEGVITSYSIHYTKLYDGRKRARG